MWCLYMGGIFVSFDVILTVCTHSSNIRAMDWGFIGTILSIVFGVAAVISIVVAIKIAKRRKPAWAYKTTKIIGLGTDAPPELKLVFNERVVPDVYRTILIFFNKGNESIRQNDVTDKVALCFCGAEILREPNIVAVSKQEIRLSVRRIVKNNDNGLEIDFVYLDRNDGVVLETLHTKCDQIRCEGNIIGVGTPKYMGDFLLYRKLSWRGVVSIAIPVLFPLIAIVPLFSLPEATEASEPSLWSLVWILSGVWWAYIGKTVVRDVLRYTKFPKWSIPKQ